MDREGGHLTRLGRLAGLGRFYEIQSGRLGTCTTFRELGRFGDWNVLKHSDYQMFRLGSINQNVWVKCRDKLGRNVPCNAMASIKIQACSLIVTPLTVTGRL